MERYGIEFTYLAITYVEQVERDGDIILPSEIEKKTEDVPITQKEKAQATISRNIKEHELEEKQREGVSIDGK